MLKIASDKKINRLRVTALYRVHIRVIYREVVAMVVQTSSLIWVDCIIRNDLVSFGIRINDIHVFKSLFRIRKIFKDVAGFKEA